MRGERAGGSKLHHCAGGARRPHHPRSDLATTDEAQREHREANLVYAKRLGESALDVASLDVAWNACMDAQSAVTEARRKASKASNVLDALTRVT